MSETPGTGTGELRIMGRPGDTKVIWNRSNADEEAFLRTANATQLR